MNLYLPINSTRQLKKRTYLVLKQMQQLEKGKRVNAIYARYVGNDTMDLYVLRCLGHLKALMTSACSEIDDSGVVKRADRVVSQIDKISQEVRNRTPLGKKVLRRVQVADLLTSHTNLFNFLLDRDYQVNIELDEWVNVTNTAIAVWGDNIAPRPRVKYRREHSDTLPAV